MPSYLPFSVGKRVKYDVAPESVMQSIKHYVLHILEAICKCTHINVAYCKILTFSGQKGDFKVILVPL